MRVLLIGAGGPAANSFARSLRLAGGYHIIGANSSADDLLMAEADEFHILPRTGDNIVDDATLLALAQDTKPDFAHSQPDEGVAALSRIRRNLRAIGCRTFLPPADHIRVCQDKWLSYLAWQNAGLPVPQTSLGSLDWGLGPLHIRPRTGAGGKDSLRQASHGTAAYWLEDKEDKEQYTVAHSLPGPTVTCQMIYRGGAVVASQLRRRLAWTDGDRGSARISEAFADKGIDALSVQAVKALGGKPHGIYGVDMTLDAEGKARLTEINIGRFFTTIEFFAHCGLNMPDFYCKGAPLQDALDMFNPLDGQKWIRCMDREPLLVA
jgi:carbamoyl-phosphate synthase large subunit